MDYKIVWTLRSREDLREIATFISKDNPAAAIKLGDIIFKRVESLQEFPELGRMLPERGQPEIRELVVKNYRIIYRIRREAKMLEIWRVWHGARGEPEI